ncbi:TPA: hypothetical protein ACL2V3_000747 [Streptococcus pneumoniae]|uniref:Uncharacterized protein n=1 Tax=Streptococcus pneumoniae TaxID=1313 RepID=A0A4J1QQ25_STREE|nr:hypothetical protein [Streptococcus pneumoniae]OYK99508.1 hypothetical protein AJ86_09935 [Streptococcus pneumoniae E709]EJG99043.1 hypothetical protein SPAR157_1692 [Streptococcus pneumoniae GA54354]EJH15608.1 hypothetical protein SPAR169_1801 [Streptococcus pneumoniae GA62331]MBW5075674.1 hypothetical protein [Streptococcus pneumoniae]MBW5077530.1 hypothetical protein [Streptococcus pneumoniae]
MKNNERLGIKLSRDSVLGLREVRRLYLGSSDIPVPDSYVIEVAYKQISNEIDIIDWVELNKSKIKISEISESVDIDATSLRTTLTLDTLVYEGMRDIQLKLRELTKGRVFFSFVVKLVLFASILKKKGLLEKFQESVNQVLTF